LHFFLFILSQQDRDSPSEIVIPVIVCFVSSLALWVVSYLIFRSRAKAALAASIFLIAIFFHKQFNIAVAVATGWEVPHQYFLTGWLFFRFITEFRGMRRGF
jgi:hypothetical protein